MHFAPSEENGNFAQCLVYLFPCNKSDMAVYKVQLLAYLRFMFVVPSNDCYFRLFHPSTGSMEVSRVCPSQSDNEYCLSEKDKAKQSQLVFQSLRLDFTPMFTKVFIEDQFLYREYLLGQHTPI